MVNRKLVQVQAAASLVTVYTVPSSYRTIIKTIDVCNTDSVNHIATLHLVPSGGTASSANQLIPGITIPAKGMLQWTGEQFLREGDFIQIKADVASAITINISGEELTR